MSKLEAEILDLISILDTLELTEDEKFEVTILLFEFILHMKKSHKLDFFLNFDFQMLY
jgi:hypothetical protein